MDNVAKIAEGLSDAQWDALRGRYSWTSPMDQDQGEAELYRLGLWNKNPKYGEKIITQLGLAVAKHIRGTTT